MPVSEAVKPDLQHCRFLDNWKGCVKRRHEYHNVVDITTDSSGFRYGAVVNVDEQITMGDYWDCKYPRPIHVKDAGAVLKTLVSLVRRIGDSRVDLRTDNMTVLRVWENGGGKDPIKHEEYLLPYLQCQWCTSLLCTFN